MNKIVFISFAVLNKNLYQALCIEYFLKFGVEVDYLDVSSLLFDLETGRQNGSIIQHISTYQELEQYIIFNKNKNILYNIQMHYETRFVKLFKLLKKHNCRQSTFEIGYLPVPNTRTRMLTYFNRPIVLSKKIINKFFDFIYIKFDFINLMYDIKFTAGMIPYDLAKKTAKKIVEINFVDYEKNLEYIRSKKENTNQKYFVFLDIFLHEHTDHQFLENNDTKSFNGAKYVETLNEFFLNIEKKYDTEVIIAAHPKSNYVNKEFANRKIIKNKTEELVFNADAVISHHSTSISYAVLNKKPIIFIYTEDIKRYMLNVYLYTDKFASDLEMPIVNIDEKLEFLFSLNINNTLYNQYKYNFLTSKLSENLVNEQIIKQFLKDENVSIIS